ncbi:MAG: HAMP domain-containing sensor histidine kinase [Clostridiaceae bacterium]
MRIFVEKEIRTLFTVIAALLLGYMLLGQVTVKLMADDYKQKMISHDYAVAGYLYRNGPDKPHITYAFTSEKTNDDLEAGQKLLQAAGYSNAVESSLLPEVGSFYKKYTVLIMVLSAVFSITFLLVLLFFALRRNERLEKANMGILSFMDGNTAVRLDDREEGSLSRLFTSINGMSTSLTSHIAKEKQNKEFLKDTISDISHQLKTPLAALKMYNEIIQDEKTGNAVVDSFTSKSRRELVRMEVLIQNLLKLARLDAGSIEPEKSVNNLRRFLEEAIEGFRTRAELEDKAIILDCDGRITLSFDEEWLMEAISNLIKNSLDHTEAKDQIVIRCDETPVLTQIMIKDNGSGIHPEDIHHIFKRFYRSRYSKDKQGAGIGLTLTKAIVEMHGGSVTVESELGKGAAFHLAFPKLSNM